MTTIIDNTQRIFLVHEFGWGTTHMVCNMVDLPKCMAHFEGNEQYKVAHIWNNKIKYLSKKEVKEILEANQLKSPY